MAHIDQHTKSILCLAHSRRPSGRCVAGKECLNSKLGRWIRPVSARDSHEISNLDMVYQDNQPSCLLDIINIVMVKPNPHFYHSENYIIDDQFYWTKVGQATWPQVVDATDNLNGPLWINGNSSRRGLNDKVSEELANDLQNSLYLISPQTLSLKVVTEPKWGGGTERRVRAIFTYNDAQYNFVVTDPWIEAKYLAGNDGLYQIPKSRLCISLSELIGGHAIKLVASVITPDRIGQNNA